MILKLFISECLLFQNRINWTPAERRVKNILGIVGWGSIVLFTYAVVMLIGMTGMVDMIQQE